MVKSYITKCALKRPLTFRRTEERSVKTELDANGIYICNMICIKFVRDRYRLLMI